MILATLQNNMYTITLDRPDQRNALTPEMSDALIAAIRSCDPGARVLLLGGTGPVFCAGFDLSLCNLHRDGSVLRHLLRSLGEAIGLLRQLHCPVVIAAQGGAIAGGCALLTAADHVVADKNARFGYPVHRLGLSPAVSLPTLAHAIGQGAVRPLAFDTHLIDGHRGLEISLIHTLVDTADQVFPTALCVAKSLSLKPFHAISATRGWLREVSPIADSRLVAALNASLDTAATPEQNALLEQLLANKSKP